MSELHSQPQEVKLQSRHRYLGGVEVNVIVLLISRQILVCVISGRSHQHHPVTVLLAAAVETHHSPIPLEDLAVKRREDEDKNMG